MPAKREWISENEGDQLIAEEMEFRRRLRKTWAAFGIGLLILQPIIQPACFFKAITMLQEERSLRNRYPSTVVQLYVIAVLSAAASVAVWYLILDRFGVFGG